MVGTDAVAPDPGSVMRSRRFLVLLALAAGIGLVASFAAWCFLELVHEIQPWVFDDLPEALGYDSAPIWWSLPVLFVSGVVTALAIKRLPGDGGHLPVDGLNARPTQPVDLPGVLLAAFAGISFGIVLGPEAPLIGLGGALGFLAIRAVREDAPEELQNLVASAGIFAAISFLFGSPVIAAVFLMEASGLGGPRLPLVLVPGLLAAGIGTLVSIGMGSWTGVDTSDISLEVLRMPEYVRPDIVDFLWTVPLAAAIAVGVFLIFRIGRLTARFATPRPLLVLPLAGLAIAGLAIGFSEAADKNVEEVLFSGQESLGPLVANPAAWSLSALALLIAFKGVAYGLALGSFRGGPVFPALFLGAAAGMMAAQLPGFELTPAVAVGLGASIAAVLRLPLAAVVLAVLLTSQSGLGAGPLIIVGVVVAYLTSLALSGLVEGKEESPAPSPSG